MIDIFGKPRHKKDKILKKHYDIAACAQYLFSCYEFISEFLKKIVIVQT